MNKNYKNSMFKAFNTNSSYIFIILILLFIGVYIYKINILDNKIVNINKINDYKYFDNNIIDGKKVLYNDFYFPILENISVISNDNKLQIVNSINHSYIDLEIMDGNVSNIYQNKNSSSEIKSYDIKKINGKYFLVITIDNKDMLYNIVITQRTEDTVFIATIINEDGDVTQDILEEASKYITLGQKK